MKTKVDVVTQLGEHGWDNFLVYMAGLHGLELISDWRLYVDVLPIALSHFNAVNLAGTRYLEFDTEEDATAFLLRFL